MKPVPSTSLPSLADILTASLPSAQLYYDYARDSVTLSTLLVAPGFTTLFIPVNSAIINLPQKPHRGPPPSSTTPVIKYASSREEEDAQKAYLEMWMERHIVAGDVDEEGTEVYQTLVDGRSVSFGRQVDGSVMVLPGGISILNIVKASNGKIILMDGTLSPEE